MKKILYIGNNLSRENNYATAMDDLSKYLKAEDSHIVKSSNKKNSLLRLLSMCVAVIKYRNFDYMLIDTFSTSAFYYAYFVSQLARFFNIKYIPILHGGNLPNRLDKSPKKAKAIFSNSFKNVAPSNYLKTEFEKRGFTTEFIPNILEIENYQYKERTQLQPKLLWVRAFRQLYNPQMAIKTLHLAKKELPNAKLCMVGPFKDDSIDDVKKLIQEYNLENAVELTGVLPKPKWLQKSTDFDIFINTTTIDNTPVSVMEAMALGLPVVSTNVGGVPYLIQDTVDGILVPNNSEEKMANAIIELIKTNNQTIAKNARKKAESFAWQEVRKKWLEILK